MGHKTDGVFSLGLAALKLQLESLFDEAGGQGALKLMDKLSTLTPETRTKTLRAFVKALDQLLISEKKITPNTDMAASDWEEGLYRDLESNLAPQLEVIPGRKEKKAVTPSEPIDLEAARRNRSSKSVLH